MNKNLVKYPIRFGTLLLAGAALVACKKEEFTEKDAWNLENTRLTRLAQLKKTSDSLARVEREGMFKWQRNLDSLDRINAGGRVFYSVIPVNANEAVFSGGRTEEALTNATVTVTQFGRTFVSSNGAVGSVATNGVYTFPEMRSGEVSVSVSAPNFTQVNYVANLTPDGGISNNGVVNVGNVIPLFELPGTGASAPTKFAVVRGKAWFEGNLTQEPVTGNPNTPGADFGVSSEERVTPEVLAGTLTGSGNGTASGTATLVTANIDLDRGAAGTTPSWFHRRFILESNDENGTGSVVGGTIRSGAIQRFSYAKAVSYGTLNADGSYAMLMPASAVGLPVKLNYSEFATNRVYYNDRGALVSSERFLYGPNVIPTAIPTPSVSVPTLEVQAFTTAAAGTATFTPQTTGTQSTSFTSGSTAITFPATATGQANINRRRGGFYVTAPTVTVSGVGTGATFAAVLTRDTSPAVAPAVSPRTNTAAEFNGTVAGTNKGDFETAFGTVNTVTITAGGSGYTSNGTLTFTRTDIVNNAGFGGQAAGGGNAGGYVNLSTTTPLQVTDGGANFLFNAAATVTTPNTFTNYLPTVVFTETNQAGSADPDKGYNALVPAVTDAAARVFVDYDATYTATTLGVAPGSNNTANGVGAIQEVRLTSAGAYPNATLPFVNFSFGQSISSGGFTATNRNLFVSNGNGGIKFNGNLTAADLSSLFTGAAGTVDGGGGGITFTTGWGSRYTYVPRVELVANAAATTVGGATLTSSLQSVGTTVTVSSDPAPANANFGKITRIVLNTPITVTFAGGTVGADNNDFLAAAPFGGVAGTNQISVRAVPQRYGNTLAAIGGGAAGRTVAIGSSLNTYSYTASAQSTSDATNLAVAMGGAISNTTTTNLTTANYLAGNNMLVVFSAPNNTAVTGRRTAWGVPTFSGNTLLGARILDGGSGYNAPTTGTVNFTSAVTAQLVPNPWFRTNQPAGTTSPSSLTTGLVVGGVNAGLPVDQDIVSFLNHPVMTAQGTASRPTPTITRARLVINVTAAGSGYSRAPRFVVSGGGLNLVEYDQAAAPTASGTPLVSTSPGGVIAFNSMIDAAGTVVKVGNGSSTGNFAGMATTAGLSQVKDANGNDVLNTFEFPVDKGPAYTGTLNLNVVEELSTSLTRSLNNTVGSGTGVGARVNVGATATVASGTVLSVRLNDNTSSFLSTANANDAQSPVVDIQTGTANAVFVAGYDSPLVPGPRTLVVGGTGTNATVQSWVTLDPRVAQHRRITAITVTSGGTGYGFVRTNSWWRANGGGMTDPRNDNGSAGQAFAILGGFESGASNNGGQGQTNFAFDALPGMTYVRDVHYGTGRRID